MNIYVVAEGEVTERRVYECWIPLVNPKLSVVRNIDMVHSDNVVIVSGGGYPYTLQLIDAAIDDVHHFGNIDRLVIAVDSEEASREERRQEVEQYIGERRCEAEIHIVVQHFCFECWALGNRRISRPQPQDPTLRKYRRHYNVATKDPELLLPCPDECLNRAHFAAKYLRLLLQDRFGHLTYSKRNPQALLHEKFFMQVKARLEETQHISSFDAFLSAFSDSRH